MAGAIAVLVALAACVLLLGAKVFAVFGFVVAFAMFQFPVGIVAIVALGVALTFILAPRHSADDAVSRSAQSGTARSAGWPR